MKDNFELFKFKIEYWNMAVRIGDFLLFFNSKQYYFDAGTKRWLDARGDWKNEIDEQPSVFQEIKSDDIKNRKLNDLLAELL